MQSNDNNKNRGTHGNSSFMLGEVSPSSENPPALAVGSVKAYKGFDKNLKCRGFQYEVGKTYEEKDAKLCETGFHACEAPLNVMDYYPPHESRYCEVELDNVSKERSNDTKVVGKKITIGAEIGIPGLVKAHVEWVKEQVKECDELAKDASGRYAKIGSSGRYAKIGSSGDAAKIGSSGDAAQIGSSGYAAQIGSSGDAAKIGSSGDAAQIGSSGDAAKIGFSGDAAQIGSSGYAAQIGSSGYAAQIGSSGDAAQIGSSGRYAKIGSSGRYAKIGSSGDDAKIGSSGRYAKIGSSGRYAKIGSSGRYAKIGSSGDAAKIGSSGDDAKIGSSGRYAQIGSSGDDVAISCECDHAVAVCAGKNARVKGPVGTWIALAEYGEYDGEGYPCIGLKAAMIDGEKLKADTWYMLKDGEFVEVEDNDAG